MNRRSSYLATGRWLGSCAVWFVVLAAGRAGWAQAQQQSFHPVSSYTAETLLRNASNHVRDGQWSEALDLYERVITQFGDAVAEVPKNDPAADPTGASKLYVDARLHCQRRLAALPAEALALYRRRVDSRAERMFRQAAAKRDSALLQRISAEMFCSSWGDDALDLQGDLAFQRGEFGEALAAYRQLLPDRAGQSLGLTYPDPEVDLARVAAKKLLCRAALGSEVPTEADLAAFAKAYPNAAGAFAGREGALVDSLKAALSADRLSVPALPEDRWPTYGGSPARTAVAAGPIDVGSFQWKVKLDPAPALRSAPINMMRFSTATSTTALSADQQLAYFPIVVGDQVVVCDDSKITSFFLNKRGESAEGPTLKELVAWDQKLGGGSQAPSATRTTTGIPRYTLTASADRVFARLGGSGRSGSGGVSTLVAVRSNREIEGKLIWKRSASDLTLPRPKGEGNRVAAYEGSPVADSRNVYIGLTESGVEIGTYVACLDAETGATKWIRYLGNSTSGFDNNQNMGFGQLPSVEVGNRLLSLDGRTLYYQTNLGALAALDADSGALRWLATYPTRERGGMTPSPLRDGNPAVVHEGLVFIAPDDALPLFAFDAATGRLVWQTSRDVSKVSYLLGVARGKLFATGDCVFSIEARTGKVLQCWPETGGVKGYGRGLLAGNAVYWPTETTIYVLDQKTGTPSGDQEPIRLQQDYGIGGGNLAIGDGYLIVAQRDWLVVFAQNRRVIEHYKELIVQQPERALNYYQLAKVAEATGQDEIALAHFEETARRAKAAETLEGQSLVELARQRQHQLLVKLAKSSAKSKNYDVAIARLEAAVKVAPTARERIAGRLALAEAQADARREQAAVDTLQELLADPKLREQLVAADERRTVRADLLVSDRLEAILQAGGRELYAEFDRKAAELLKLGQSQREPRFLEEVGRSYPVALVAPEALLALARLHEGDRPDEAARVYKRLLAIAPNDSYRARAIWGLARAYEARKLWWAARESYVRAQARFAPVRIEWNGEEATLGSLAAERLGRPPFDRMGGERGGGEPVLAPPLVRRWSQRTAEPVRPLAIDGQLPNAAAPRILLVQGTKVYTLDPEKGQEGWSRDLGDSPAWAGYLADKLIVATAGKLVALAASDGRTAWSFPQDGGAFSDATDVNPFARIDALEGKAEDRPRSRAGLAIREARVAGGRVLVLRGERELLALDGDTGEVDWTFAPPAGQINSRMGVGIQRLLLQVVGPNTAVVLDLETGRRREYPLGGEGEPWAHDPFPVDDDRVVLTLGSESVGLFDTAQGALGWIDREKPVFPRTTPPRPLGDSGRLLVLYAGSVLVRLDPATGARLWSKPLGIEDISDWPRAFAWDHSRLYAAGLDAGGPTISAIDLKSGERVWTQPLTGPKTPFAVALTESYVVSYPTPRRGPTPALDSWALCLFRRDTGRLVQRVSIAEPVADVEVRLAAGSALIATQGGVWSLAAMDADSPAR